MLLSLLLCISSFHSGTPCLWYTYKSSAAPLCLNFVPASASHYWNLPCDEPPYHCTSNTQRQRHFSCLEVANESFIQAWWHRPRQVGSVALAGEHEAWAPIRRAGIRPLCIEFMTIHLGGTLTLLFIAVPHGDALQTIRGRYGCRGFLDSEPAVNGFIALVVQCAV